MKIKINNQEILIINANTFLKKLKGLMHKKNINYGMYFPKTNSIHTFFMKDNIDVIGLNENNIIIYKKENVSKNKMLFINYKYQKTSVLELPKNTSQSLNIGDKITFYK